MISHRKLFAPPTAEDVMMVCFDAIASTKSRPRAIVFQDSDFLPLTYNTGVDDTAATATAAAGTALLAVPSRALPVHVLRFAPQ